jgi:hypothetical protein
MTTVVPSLTQPSLISLLIHVAESNGQFTLARFIVDGMNVYSYRLLESREKAAIKQLSRLRVYLNEHFGIYGYWFTKIGTSDVYFVTKSQLEFLRGLRQQYVSPDLLSSVDLLPAHCHFRNSPHSKNPSAGAFIQ